MNKAHNAQLAQVVGVTLTFIIETFFSFLAGWAMYDEFSVWGFLPSIVIGVLAGLVFLLLGLYVFILREYAIDANKLFARLRREHEWKRLAWAFFLVALVVAIESFINANRMSVLPLANEGAKVFLWLMFQALVFVPLALGKLVHGHINATDPALEERKFYTMLDTAFYTGVQKQLSGMGLGEIAQLRQGNTHPIQTRIVAEQEAIDAAKAGEAEHPLARGLREFQPGETGEIQALNRQNGRPK